jgi:Exo-beta-D-glucosaminidase Ig-fold domain/Concanavalin A-like lectin/glucanases superfamily/Glycosyl hydrolases family 2/Glycosyl hydrolases family 2, sugar binding domain/Glycosyl hydrolases family 2, TIM barrel domain
MLPSFRQPLLLIACAWGATTGYAASPADNAGPYNLTFLEGGIGMSRPLASDNPALSANAAWSITGWVRPTLGQSADVVIAAVGDTTISSCRCLMLHDGKLQIRANGFEISTPRPAQVGNWYALAATYDGQSLRLYIDGQLAGTRQVNRQLPAVSPTLALAPPAADPEQHFGGSLAQFQLEASAASPERAQQLYNSRPDFPVMVFQTVGAGWPWQEHAWRGLLVPQDPWTLPRSNTPPQHPTATPDVPTPALQASGDNIWMVGAWRLAEAPKVTATGVQLSTAQFDASSWYSAVVPGTVLTTLIARGVYPDPTYGLNNMAIPESLNKQDYWYRTSFDTPAGAAGRQFTLTFNGINYAAEVWLNGARLGQIKGAFARGIFDVTAQLKPGQVNTLAVRVSPPPHPGIPHEESIAAGPGGNGGNLAIDGPTFVATEGWDWIPGVRDRNTGIWQDVQLQATGAIQLLDPHVVTRLPLPKTDTADISIEVALENHNSVPTPATIEARVEGMTVRKSVTVPPGITKVDLTPDLHIDKPRLWWPNGYGSPELYTMTLSVADGTRISDSRSIRFGIRQITYDLSLFDHQGRLRRVEVDPTAGSARAERLIDVRHEAIKKTANGWAESLTAAGETSPAVRDVPTKSLAPYLAIRVNGVPIAVRGGSWGTDDLLKRVSRERLEPYFRLHRAANLNIIRNWLGQNTEEMFYDLADEYGLLILNDFWASTQDYQVEPEDPQLFLANAREVLLRFRNHPSIAVWFGRNEGVPQPIINEGLADLIASLDGTRHYTGSSNSVNLQGSGPYNYRPPVQYFTELARGFSVEVGTPSLATLESIEAMVPAADRWPISDTLAYHDWHYGGNGDVASFMNALEQQLGAPTSLADFERKAQMLNYVSYRAVFEGFQAHLWTQNSGRLLWMTHPAWPSNHWEIYSSDYDTQASYYGVKSACEPVHAQMNLPDYRLAVVNTTRAAHRGLTLTSRVFALDGRLLAKHASHVSAAANSTLTLPSINLAPALAAEDLVLVVLTLDDAHGQRLSQNTYWQGRDDHSQQKLNALAPQNLSVTTHTVPRGMGTLVSVTLENKGTAPALATKLTVVDANGKRVLPVLYSDNYVSLLPHEPRTVEIVCPTGGQCSNIQLRGWNVVPVSVPIKGGS